MLPETFHNSLKETQMHDWQWQPVDSKEIHNALSFLLGFMQIRQKSKECVS